jgi:hypothetical protein
MIFEYIQDEGQAEYVMWTLTNILLTVGYILCMNTILKNRQVQATTFVGIAEVAN